MDTPFSFLFLVLSLALYSPTASSTSHTLYQGSSLSTEKPGDVLTSQNGVFSAGFYSVGSNAYCFAIWFNYPSYNDNRTVVWMANRDQPVNGRRSKLSLLNTGNLNLTDAGQFTVWATDIDSSNAFSSVQLHLDNTGNLVLRTLLENVTLWESFKFPTDTLLPQQQLTGNAKLVSSRSQSNYSSGFYKLYFDDDNVLKLLYDGFQISSVFWPEPWLRNWETGRSSSDSSRIAFIDTLGGFNSTDGFTFHSADYGSKLERRLRIDHDGNVRLYSWDAKGEKWLISWQARPQSCSNIHGSCGPNSMCIQKPGFGRKTCSCLPGYEVKNDTDWAYGCEPKFNLSCTGSDEVGFLRLPHVDFYGNDYKRLFNSTLEDCKKFCSDSCTCKAFQYAFLIDNNCFMCYPKTLLRNGCRSTNFEGELYLKLPKSNLSSYDNYKQEEFELNCKGGVTFLDRKYVKSQENETVKFMLWVVYGLGGFQIVCIFLVSCFLFWTQKNSGEDAQVYAITGFRKFTYAELRKATQNFSEEIGRGAGGIVYKGELSDHRVAAIKQLNEANQGEGEFLAEVSIIGRLNHMNLIEMWGYCVEGKHRLLVYEYMDHGSLAKNFSSKALDWKKRYEIALGTAKGLAYLHEECLEWVLHCDIKPQNILLDSNDNPKVADFGLSKLQNRGDLNNSSFSRMRGTRGYMAPEWIFNLPITSKVDVYSYGIVVLEMVTGKSPTMGVYAMDDNGGTEQRRLVTWVREKKQGAAAIGSWMGEIIDPMMEGRYDINKMEILVGVALQCVQEDKDARPTMSQVVEMLLRHENDDLVNGSM